uniref:Transmembrane protein with metallophosphoesterase domain n=1 Tax=Sinocyclocheilus anshuiensis TaxID=1608454 RepID=A0A671MIT1_9TELE
MFGFGRLSAEWKVGIASGSGLTKTLVLRCFAFSFSFSSTPCCSSALYIWKLVVRRLCGSRGAPSVPQRCWRLLVLLFLTLVHGSYLCMFFLVDTEPHWLSLLCFSCLGIYVILLFFLFVFGCLKREEDAVASGSVSHIVLAMIVTAILAVYGLLNAAQPPRVIEVEIPVEKLPESLNGLRLVLLSDIHLGPTVGRSKLQRIVSYDVVVIVGDLTDSRVTRLRSAAEPLGQMKARLGSYFATGNHDYYTADVEGWFELLRSMGIQALHNSHAKVFRPEQTQDWICLAGIDDLEARMLRYPGHGMDVEKALSGCSAESPIILLAHQPHAAKQALQQRPDISLVLSGHTHAGQLFPLTILAFLMNPFFCGLYRVSEHTMVYVTPGTSHYGIPMRIASRSEITNIILKRA